MINYLLDTDTCIYLINRRPELKAESPPKFCAISVIVLGELEYGLRQQTQPERREAIAAFLKRINVSSIPPEAGAIYADIRDSLTSRGQMIGPNDLWIAAHARALNVALVTNNLKEFNRIPQLRVETWLSGQVKPD